MSERMWISEQLEQARTERDQARLDIAAQARELAALRKFGEHKNWSLQYVAKVYADDDEPEADHWAVFEESGSINDREWKEIGAGATPREAIDAALEMRGCVK